MIWNKRNKIWMLKKKLKRIKRKRWILRQNERKNNNSPRDIKPLKLIRKSMRILQDCKM